MEKISGILRSSPRVKAVDLKASHPIRPGTPRFGRPEGRNTIKEVQDKFELSQRAEQELAAMREAGLGESALSQTQPQTPTTYRNPKEMARAKIVENMTAKFFATKNEPVVRKTSERVLEASTETAPQEQIEVLLPTESLGEAGPILKQEFLDDPLE